ncbi:hypothetical protein EDB89DRAFT_1906152 [Lactarius sanguifluus]|nr:hypothetical protein EDB89DRAFT_1906152 [Lactarius sanguifluus]
MSFLAKITPPTTVNYNLHTRAFRSPLFGLTYPTYSDQDPEAKVRVKVSQITPTVSMVGEACVMMKFSSSSAEFNRQHVWSTRDSRFVLPVKLGWAWHNAVNIIFRGGSFSVASTVSAELIDDATCSLHTYSLPAAPQTLIIICEDGIILLVVAKVIGMFVARSARWGLRVPAEMYVLAVYFMEPYGAFQSCAKAWSSGSSHPDTACSTTLRCCQS